MSVMLIFNMVFKDFVIFAFSRVDLDCCKAHTQVAPTNVCVFLLDSVVSMLTTFFVHHNTKRKNYFIMETNSVIKRNNRKFL